MTNGALRGCRLLVVEDEYFIADDLARSLEDAGATVVGPVATLSRALECIEAAEKIDGAVLDINLAGEMVYPIADRLMERGVPFVFATGYERIVIPALYAAVVRCEKPVSPGAIARALQVAIVR